MNTVNNAPSLIFAGVALATFTICLWGGLICLTLARMTRAMESANVQTERVVSAWKESYDAFMEWDQTHGLKSRWGTPVPQPSPSSVPLKYRDRDREPYTERRTLP